MKIYTEEQVIKAIKLSLLNAKLFIHKGLGDDKYFPTVYEALKNLTPIELPSDEEVEKCAEVLYPINKGGSMFMPSRDDINKANKQEGFLEGAKWMKEQILNQNK
jgi:hypothetical protein